MTSSDFVVARFPLFVSGIQPGRFTKAASSGADAVIVDLEDAVVPEQKAEARSALAKATVVGAPLYVRVNGVGTPWWADDLACLRNLELAAVVLPKSEFAGDIEQSLESIGRHLPVIPLVETAKGLFHLPEILASPAVVVVAFGSLDFALDLGCAHCAAALAPARGELVLRSRLARKASPIDGVTADFRNPNVVASEARHAAELGFGGKLLIHPNQIEPARAAFSPDEATIQWAKRVMGASSSAGAIGIDGAMIDRPVLERARRVLGLLKS